MTNIKACDVLLYHGTGFISWAIRKFDGSDVNHAAIALDGARLGEAGGVGLQIGDIMESVARNSFVIVRRFNGTAPLAPVVAKANEYLAGGRPYAYQQIVLLALLASTRKIPMPAAARPFLRSALDHAAAAINAFIDVDGRGLMICSEFVYRCYEEADPATYHLRIQVGSRAFNAAAAGASLVDWALQQPEAKLPRVVAPSFGIGESITPSNADAIAEAKLAPLIAAYAEVTGLADDDLPDLPVTPSFSGAQVVVTDEELLASLAAFGAALQHAGSPGTPTFGIGSVLGAAAVRGAIQGIAKVAIEANFVTPGDLLRSPSLSDLVRLPS